MTPAQLHKLYGDLTGLAPSVNMLNEYSIMLAWILWQKAYTEADLRLVVRYLVSRIKRDGWKTDVLNFNCMVRDYEKFGERLAEAKAWDRNRMQPSKPTFTPVVVTPPQTDHSRRVSQIVNKLVQQKTIKDCIAEMRRAAS